MKGIFPRKCPECGSNKLQFNTDGLICAKCGLVVSDTIFAEDGKY